MTHLSAEALHAGLDHIRRSPADRGRVELFVRRPAANQRGVNSPLGRTLNLRGVNARVVSAGGVRVGDTVTKLPREAAAS